MKRILFVMAFFLAASCHHHIDKWPSDGDKQDVAMYVRTRSLTGISSPPSAYQLFVYDKQAGKTFRYDVTPEKNDQTQLRIKLLPGTYTGYCLTNAAGDEFWEYAENKQPEQIYLKAQKTKNGTEEAADHLAGQCDFTVTGDNNNSAVFELSRKVGMLKITIENIPAWLTDLRVNLSHIPQKMNLTGSYTGEYTISKKVTLPDNKGVSETNLLVFPPLTQSYITLSSEAMVFITPEHPISSILANHVTQIKATFLNDQNLPDVDISTHLVEWDDQIIEEPGWEIELPDGPCEGNGDGHNLVANSGFEEGFTENIPTGWKLDNSGATKRVVEVNTPIYAGTHAVRLEGKTYLYQDIPISGGKCYQFKAQVNAPSENIKWRYWCTWMNGSTSLPSEAIRVSSYRNQTEGYTDAFEGKIFRAPANANKLRVEFRTYMDPISGEGLYIDEVSIEKVN